MRNELLLTAAIIENAYLFWRLFTVLLSVFPRRCVPLLFAERIGRAELTGKIGKTGVARFTFILILMKTFEIAMRNEQLDE